MIPYLKTARRNARPDSVARSSLAIICVVGISLFFFLYAVAASYYPGGSTVDITTSGFNIYTNYWCDLLGSHAKNGQHNPAQPVALTAMVILCLALAYFWYVTPALFEFTKVVQKTLQIAGVLSMSIAPFIFTAYHDTIINIAGSLGLMALIGTLVGLYQRQFFAFFGLGVFCLFLCGVNNFIYYTHLLISYLPVIQKITFSLFLLWFCLVSLTVRRNPIAHE